MGYFERGWGGEKEMRRTQGVMGIDPDLREYLSLAELNVVIVGLRVSILFGYRSHCNDRLLMKLLEADNTM